MQCSLLRRVNNNKFIRINAWQFSIECRRGILRNIIKSAKAISCCALVISLLSLKSPPSFAADDVARIKIGYISQQSVAPPNLSNLDVPPENEGFAGGEISIRDNNTTGRFLKQEFLLETAILAENDDPVKAMEDLAAKEVKFFVLDVAGDTIVKLADTAAGRDLLFFNATATDNRLRQQDCRGNVMHIVPSRAMYTDALAQFLIKKRWRKWFLVTGTLERDVLFAQSIRQSARKFGGKIVEEKQWAFGPDARRTAQAEVPGFTQGIDYDVLIVADEIGIFGEYLMYRTWKPQLIAGTQGLSPSTWHRTHEQWGSAQLQSRFFKRYKRRMRAKDYQVWAPIRAIGEAATRTNSADFSKMVGYLKSTDFELAGFKGVPLTFRDWNWQLRQPILLIQPSALVS
ncbi:MAG: ABC transporter substrate-binding protein, partial [Hyphomicrobiales bacterium]|nr:ABC transporter substrate-binding protein [Hyphomicrobiales bacterium]